MSGPPGLLARALSVDPARPLVTAYDDRTGDRVELSAASLGNAVAKCAGLLRDELDVEPGDLVVVALGAHWRALAVLFGAWSVGARVRLLDPATLTPADLPADVRLLVVAEDAAAAAVAATDGPDLAVVALGGLALGLAAVPSGVVDLVARMRAHPDRFTPYDDVAPGAPALDAGGDRLAGADVVAAAERFAVAHQLGTADRVLSTVDWTDPATLVAGALGPLAAAASLVLVRNPDLPRLADRAAAERVTATVGADVTGVRRLR